MPSVRVAPRIRLRMLGTFEVADGNGAAQGSLVPRPKTLALLAYLACECRSGPVSRDTLLGIFWPESNTASARHALRQVLYELRHALGPDILHTSGQHEVELNRDRFTADTIELCTALDEGRIDDALHLYQGELLPGLHFADAAPEFEAWLERARARVRQRLTDALWQAHTCAAEAGNAGEALRLARRGLDLNACDEAGLRRLMELLRRCSRHAEALQLFRRFRASLAAELDVPCARETVALAEAIEAELGPPDAGPALAPASAGGPDREASPESSAVRSELPRPPRLVADRARGEEPARRRGTAAQLLALSAALALLAYLGAAAVGTPPRGLDAAPTAGQRLVASPAGDGVRVGPFTSRGMEPETGDALALAFTWVLAGQDLAGVGSIAGEFEPSAAGLQLALEITGPGGTRRRLMVHAENGLVELVRAAADSLATVLRLDLGTGLGLLPTSDVALRAFHRGERLLERGEVDAAADAFERAAAVDTTHALSYQRLAWAAGLAFDGATAQRAEQKALMLQHRLPEAEARIVEARRMYRAGEPDEAESLLQSVLAGTRPPRDVTSPATLGRPGHPEAVFGIAEVLYHYNPLRGRPISEAAPLFARAEAAPAGRAEAFYHEAQIALLAADTQQFDRLSAQLLALAPQGSRSRQVGVLRARLFGPREEWRRQLFTLIQARDFILLSTAHNLAVYAADLPAAIDVLAIATRPDREAGVRARAHALRADLLAASGRPSAAVAELRRALALDPVAGVHRGAHLLTLGVLPPGDPVVRRFARDILSAPALPVAAAALWLGVEAPFGPSLDRHARALAALALGDSAPALRLQDDIDSAPDPGRAQRLLAADLALRLGASPAREDPYGPPFLVRGVTPEEAVLSPLFSRPLARLALGRHERGLGRTRQADRWFAALLEHSLPDLALAAVALGERARTAELRGDTAAARRLDEQLHAMQRDAEPGYVAWRNHQPWAPRASAVATGALLRLDAERSSRRQAALTREQTGSH